MNFNPAGDSYTECPDEKLVFLARQKDKEAAAVLISRYISLINKYAFQYREILDFDDLVQEGSIGLLDAISSFKSDKDVKFRTYASVCIRNRIMKAVEKNTSQKAGAFLNSVSLEDAAEKSDGLTPEKIFINRESLQTVLDDVNRVLSPMERKTLFFHLGGLDYQTIADTLGVPLKSVDNALQRVRRKLKSIYQA